MTSEKVLKLHQTTDQITIPERNMDGTTVGKEPNALQGVTGQSQKSSSETQSRCTYQGSSSGEKRRKIDSDGFVKPNTPDLKHFSGTDDFLKYQGLTEFSQEESLFSTEEVVTCSSPSEDKAITCQPLECRAKGKVIAEKLKELGQESKSLHTSWTQSFMDSQSFELFCPARLEHLMEEASALEKSLLQQKDALYRRLHVISQTLEM